MLLMIDNYDSFTFNLVHYLEELGPEVKVVRNDQVTVAEALALQPEAIIVSPGPCTPTEAGISLALIREVAKTDLPLLGVCLGMQAIGQAFGGTVKRAPKPMHGKTSAITHRQTALFAAIPSPFTATRYHSLMVAKEDLPDVLEVTAEAEDGVIMGLRHKSRAITGVQFHPESIASEHGHHLLANFLDLAGVPHRSFEGLKP